MIAHKILKKDNHHLAEKQQQISCKNIKTTTLTEIAAATTTEIATTATKNASRLYLFCFQWFLLKCTNILGIEFKQLLKYFLIRCDLVPFSSPYI